MFGTIVSLVSLDFGFGSRRARELHDWLMLWGVTRFCVFLSSLVEFDDLEQGFY